MKMKFYSPLTAEFFPDEPDWEDESYNEYEGYPMDGHDLLQYADAVDEAVKKALLILTVTLCSITTRTILSAARW